MRDILNPPVVVACVLVPLLIAAVYFGIQGERKMYAKCADLGGHMISKTSSGLGIGPNIGGGGGVSVVPTTTTVQFCISDDGRILF